MMREPIRVYVAGPYSASPERCTQFALDIGTRLLDLGFAPYVPHLNHYWHLRSPQTYERWLELDFAWLAVAHVLLRMPGASPGADREVQFAQERSVPVFYGVHDLVKWAALRP